MAHRQPTPTELTNAASQLPAVLYDGACPFCRAQAERVRRFAGPVAVEPLQRALDRLPWLDPDEAVTALHLVDRDGRTYAGAAAIVRLMRLTRPWFGALLLPYHLPGVRQLADRAYAAVAARRYRLPGVAARDADGCGDGACGVPWTARNGRDTG